MATHGPKPELPTDEYAPGRVQSGEPTTALGCDTAGLSPTTRPNTGVPESLPAVLGEYDLLHRAGEGGMGVVYQARHRPSGRIVALKMLRPELGRTPEMLQRFRREIRIADALRHPNIAAVGEVGEADERFFYTLPYAPTNLAKQLARFGDPTVAARFMVLVAGAVHHAHIYGIIHRDLKPGNILLGAAHEPLVADFGLARWVDASQQLTRQGNVLMGTPAYMAPEQVTGPSDELGPAADIWALGVILYELVAGQRPFEGSDPSTVLSLVREAKPRPPREFRPDLDPALEAIVLKCLRKPPSERYASAAALADDLMRWLDGAPVHAQSLPSTSPGRSTRAPIWPKRYVAAAMLLVGAPLLIFGGVVGGLRTDGTTLRLKDADIDWKSPFPSRDRLNWVERRLAAGQPVDMVVGHSAFRWFTRVYDFEQRFTIRPDSGGGGVRVTHADIGLAALVENPLSPQYRIEAVMTHMERVGPRTTPAFGIFFGYGGMGEGPARMSYYLNWTFNDLDDVSAELRAKVASQPGLQPPPDGNQAQLNIWLYDVDKKLAPGGRLNVPGWNDRFTPAARSAPIAPAPRRFVVEVRPDNVTVSLDGRRVGQVSRDEISRRLSSTWAARGLLGRAPVFDPRGGLGVYVRGTSTTVQSFVVTPLGNQE